MHAGYFSIENDFKNAYKRAIMARKAREKQLSTRDSIMRELLQSERDYVAALDTITKVWYKEFHEHLSREDMSSIFCNIQIIANLGRQTCFEIEKVWDEWFKEGDDCQAKSSEDGRWYPATVVKINRKREKESNRNDTFTVVFTESNQTEEVPEYKIRAVEGGGGPLGRVFLTLMPFMKMYTVYINNISKAHETLERLQREGLAEQAVQRCMRNPLNKGVHLRTLLLLPVKRIPQYNELVQNLLRCTNNRNDDYVALEHAAKLLRSVVEYMNIRKKQAENMRRVIEISNELKIGTSIITPTRRFEKCGVFSSKRKKKDTFVYLFNDLMVVGKRERAGLLARHESGVKFCDKFPIDGLIIATEGTKVRFVLGGKTRLTITMENPEEREEWIAAITELQHEVPQNNVLRLNTNTP